MERGREGMRGERGAGRGKKDEEVLGISTFKRGRNGRG
jgi:hypothetical protein